MAAVSPKVLNWLYSVLTNEYHNVDRTYSDVAQSLSKYPTLSLRTDVYTYENGRSSLLLNISGTLPVSFRGATYMFPISIWVPHAYAREGPLVFVTPTNRMAIRPGQYVSVEGRIYHPYLASWREDRFNIVDFLNILQGVFTKEPPVISRQERLNGATSPSVRDTVPPPLPPLPPELESPAPQVRVSGGPPTPPPKPFGDRREAINITSSLPSPPIKPDQYKLHAQSSQALGPSFPKHRLQYAPLDDGISGRFNRPPSIPVQDSQAQAQRPYHDPNSPVSPITPQSHQNRFPPSVNPYSHLQHNGGPPDNPQPPYQQIQEIDTQQPSRQDPSLYQNRPQIPPQQYPHQQPEPYGSRRIQQQSKHKPPDDLLTSPFENPIPTQLSNAPAPPIPPNPQKDALLHAISSNLIEQANSIYQSNQSAIPALQAQQLALSSTTASINQEMAQLQQLQSLLSSNEAILHQAMRDADLVMEEAKHRKVPAAEEVLVAPTVVAGQLYELVAEVRSIEDCRAVLARALDKGRLGGDIWAKQTRSLARKEFMKKALIDKIARGMGLTENEWN